jgi:ATPase subunit of ABC transporter with duplicated ATPase domains
MESIQKAKGELIMKFTKNMKKQFREERDATFRKMRAEEDYQDELRQEIETATGNYNFGEAKAKYDRSIANWEQLNKHYAVYDALASKQKFKVTPDTVLIVSGSLIEILLILYKEKGDIITSKAINYVLRKKV